MSIVEIPNTRRYWLIRAGTNSGEFYEQFKVNNVVAVGHANSVRFDFNDGHILSDAEKEQMIGSAAARLQESSSQRKKGEVTRLKGQLRRFLYEVSEGDTVITLKESDKVLVGVVTSKPYYSDRILQGRTTDSKECDYNLRINVDWGSAKSRDLVPLNLDKTLRIPNTITEFKEPHQIRTLNHWLYPIYFADGEVRCSLRIASEDDLSNHQLTILSQTLDQLDVISSFIEFASRNHLELNLEEFSRYMGSGQAIYGLKAQHLFMSPGYKFVQLSGSDLKRLAFASLLSFAFGNAQSSNLELPIDFDFQAALNLVNQVAHNEDITAVKDELKVSLSQTVTSHNENSMGISLEDTSADSDAADESIF
ncbi:putative Uncharacterized phage protein [Vibrio chagasii]|nr:putative Uncharacterized phage protein [Vibrio chagasii]CAH7249388.1 putative Uncharacterized phage protein [Vibrio chagasii]CAH7267853.1 putative Uncharacterized phage protein [Vibrio chagasii]CAH7455286.1 putative Uncharacterized phage protein [Vibrio chagasii]